MADEVVNMFDPFPVNVGATAVKIFAGVQDLYAYTLFIKVRSMGGASYVALGTKLAQEDRLIGVGDFVLYEVQGHMVNAGLVWAISDTAGAPAVLEVSGLFKGLR
jgi:hypothetical protein